MDPLQYIQTTVGVTRVDAAKLFGVFVLSLVVFSAWAVYILLYLVAPVPRPPRASEKRYRSVLANGQTSELRDLPGWLDQYREQKKASDQSERPRKPIIADAECFMSLVVPAFNEEDRLRLMLEEAVNYLQREYGPNSAKKPTSSASLENGNAIKQRKQGQGQADGSVVVNGVIEDHASATATGWEVLIVSDGSTDRTVDTALDFAKRLPAGEGRENIRVVELESNRGKGGAVTQGMAFVRGHFAIFADADGASKFEDLGKLLRRCQEVEDKRGRAVAVGSRAHLVGSEVVVKRSFIRNLLMHAFHLLIRLLTPPSTGLIKDTQCGFKLFSRPSLPDIIPYMHSEGWIFDVEMLMLAESAHIPVTEVPVGWREVKGSKLNVIRDSLGMAWGLAILRAAWGLGIYEQS